MLKIKVQNGRSEVMVSGGMLDVAAELGTVISDIYQQIGKQNADAAELFKHLFCEMAAKTESPLWDMSGARHARCAVVRHHDDPITSAQLAEMLRAGATPDAVLEFMEGSHGS